MKDIKSDFKDYSEKAFLFFPYSVSTEDGIFRTEEFKELSSSAGAEIVGSDYQIVRDISPASYLGSGKLADLKTAVAESGASLFLFDGELSPAQARNIGDLIGKVRVVDREQLILDIFAQRAVSAEGKLQVELAQLTYLYPRLKGLGTSLSRLGGGIGTRGPGETQLETDRRHVRARIASLKRQLDEVKERRKLQRERRNKNDTFVVALCGYTNTGKSTLLNAVTGSSVPSENKLFATLDPTARKFETSGFPAVMIDTVGFIRNIPTDLIDAFRSTLDSVCEANLILCVADASGDHLRQTEETLAVLNDLKVTAPIIKVYNKCDLIGDFSNFPPDSVLISAQDGTGLGRLKTKILSYMESFYCRIRFVLHYDEIDRFFKLKRYCASAEIRYTENGAEVDAVIPRYYLNFFSSFQIIHPDATSLR